MNSTLLPPSGRTTRAALEAARGWEQLRAQAYEPQPQAISTIRRLAPGAEAIVFVAAWCGDCKREVPRFFRIADEAGIAAESVTLCIVDRSMRDVEGLAAQWGVRCVPTFVFLRGGRELGRVLERPRGTLEGDIAAIFAAG